MKSIHNTEKWKNLIDNQLLKLHLFVNDGYSDEFDSTNKEDDVYCFSNKLSDVNNKQYYYIDKLGNIRNVKTIKNFGKFKIINIPIVDKNIISCFVRVKITNYEKSSELFGYKPTKKAMFESKTSDNEKSNNFLYDIEQICENFISKKDGKTYNVVILKLKSKNNEVIKKLKFVEEDLEFVYPDLDKFFKSITIPKDRKIKSGSVCKIIDDRKIPISRNSVVKVINISSFNTKTKLPNGKLTKTKSYAYVLFNNKEYTINSNKLKVI